MYTKSIPQILILLGICAALVIALGVWAQKSSTPQLLQSQNGESMLNGPLSPEALSENANQETVNTSNRIATFTTNKGTFQIELFEQQMPITTGNFIKLAQEGFYDNTKFHRVIDGFMIQGGDPNSKGDNEAAYGQGGPGYAIQDEFVEAPNLSNVRGTIAMANTGQPNSGGSQFFINTVDNLGLDFNKEPLSSKHPVFGHVVSGMEVIDAISEVETGMRDVPVEPVIIESITISAQE